MGAVVSSRSRYGKSKGAARYLLKEGEQCTPSSQLVTVPKPKALVEPAKPEAEPTKLATSKRRKAGKLGVIRLDYDYPPAPGDIDSPESYAYEVVYRVVPGLTFTMCQSGVVTDEVQARLETAIHYLEEQGVASITGDCGFMMYLQRTARGLTSLPIFMSALCQLPALNCAYCVAKGEQIAIFTANSETLTPMRDLIREECGLDMLQEDCQDVPGFGVRTVRMCQKRFIIVGCQDVPGFEAVAAGEKVNTRAVEPGMMAKAKAVLAEHPNVKAILLECTELPPYADALRLATGLPVYDAITACDFFMTGVQDNERFGMQNWHEDWDCAQGAYTFAANLTEEEKALLVNTPDEPRAETEAKDVVDFIGQSTPYASVDA